jgi:hypothetical protein
MKNIKTYELFEKAPGLTKAEIPKSIYQFLFNNNILDKYLKTNDVEVKEIKFKKDIKKDTEILAIKDEDNYIFLKPSFSKYYDGVHFQNGEKHIIKTKLFSKITKYITKDHKIYEILNNKSKKKKKKYEQTDYSVLEKYLVKKILDLKNKTAEEIIPNINDYTIYQNGENPSFDMLKAIGTMNYFVDYKNRPTLLYNFGNLFKFYEKGGYEEDRHDTKEKTLIFIKNMRWDDFVDMHSMREIKTEAAEKYIKSKKFNL